MKRNTFPPKPYVRQTFVGLDGRLYYWNGGKWVYVGQLLLDKGDLKSGILDGIPDLQIVTEQGNHTTLTIKHAPAEESDESVILEQLQDGSLIINGDNLLIDGLPLGIGGSGIPVHQVGHGFVKGSVVRTSGVLYVGAKADKPENADAVGIVSKVIDADNFEYVADGWIPGLGAPDENYFLSPTVAGEYITLGSPEVWNIGEVRLSVGWGTAYGFKVEISVGEVIADLPYVEGAQGFQGEQGNQGLKGDQGDQGVQGGIGAQGVEGNQGVQGNTGVQGYQGDKGYQGLQGVQGIQGNLGVQGNQGNIGNQGVQGEKGVQGNQGNLGQQGLRGYQGSFGHQGDQGTQGVKGDRGNQGSVGDKGEKGSQGNQGYQGNLGNQGYQGYRGYQGHQGHRGHQGHQGEKGEKGDQGVQGTQGPIGYQGFQGHKGDQGDDGTSINIQGSVTTSGNLPSTGNEKGDAYISEDDGHIWIWDGFGWVDGGLLKGPKGDRGNQGYQGHQGQVGNDSTVEGPQGVKGVQGVQGVQGNDSTVQGPQGPQGTQGNQSDVPGPQGYQSDVPGPQGYQGNDGEDSTVQGPQGEPGSDGEDSTVPGPKGDQGYQGNVGNDSTVPGPKGDQGYQGNQGNVGDTGSKGDTGAVGEKGDQGYQGNQGVEGLRGFQGYQGNQGISGLRGYQGYQGIVGSAGTRWHSGSTLPSSSLGENGDFYYRSGYEIIYKKVNGSWSYQDDLTGSKGDQGNTGATGPKGDRGDQGNVGADGPRGYQGYQGVAGSNGSNGTDGTDGTDGTKWYSGNLYPSTSLGVNGDFYYRDGYERIYKKINGSWVFQDDLTGSTGATGPKGDQGVPGSDGADGSTGPQGPSGPEGPKGNQGDPGQPYPSCGNKDIQLSDGNGGLTCDPQYLYWDPFNKRLGLSNSQPETILDVGGDGTFRGRLGVGTSDIKANVHVYKNDAEAMIMAESSNNNAEGAKLRLTENKHQGGYLHYDGNSNMFIIGVNTYADYGTTFDKPVINIQRDDRYMGFLTQTPKSHFQFNGNMSLNSHKFLGFNTYYGSGEDEVGDPATGWCNIDDGYGFSLKQESFGEVRLNLSNADKLAGRIQSHNYVTFDNATGNVKASNFVLNSQRNLKKNITTATGMKDLDKIQLQKFQFKDDETNRVRYGAIAEEVEEYYPEMVYQSGSGIKSVGYIDLLVAKVARLEEKIKELENK